MSVAPLPIRRGGQPGTGAAIGRDPRSHAPHASPSVRDMARRRRVVTWAKRLLPLAALVLLGSLAIWPELSRETDTASRAFRAGGVTVDGGAVVDAHYSGVDARDRPYTLTATVARQTNPDRIDLTDVKADLGGGQPGWLMIQAKNGVYNQHTGQLDLSGDVHIYRDDGTTMVTDSTAVDLKAGAAAGAELVHVEGPFGTLDAQGFASTGRGTIIQFTGPGRLILNGRRQ